MKFLQDVRFSLRLLRKSPGFTIVAVITLAIGIGANAVVFAVMNSLILNPLNVPEAKSFYEIERLSDYSAEQSYPDYVDLRDRNQSFESLAAYAYAQAGLDTGREPSRVWIVQASSNYFDVVGVQPYLGRFFHGSEEHGPNSMPYIVLSHAYWHTHFHDDPGVIGRVVQLNKHPFTILGVAKPEFHGTLLFFSPDLYTPMVNQQQVEGGTGDVLNARGTRWVYMTMGHLKPGVTPVQASGDIDNIWSYLEKTYPKEHLAMKFKLARPGLYGDFFERPVRAFLVALMLLALLILLAACANLGSLFAARAADRAREVALRLALGSSRRLILRQLFTEATLISLMGGTLGVLASIVLLRGLSAWRPFTQFPVNLPVNPDINVYAVALLLALGSGFLFGSVPVRQILRTNSYEIIKSGSSGAGRRRITVRDVLLIAQITICAVLVTSSMVAVRGLVRSLHGNYGFEPRNAMLVDTNLSMAGYTGDSVLPMQKRMIDALGSIPGVTAVGLVNWPPLTGDTKSAMVFTDQTAELTAANAAGSVIAYYISPDYFQAAGTALQAGRGLSWHDDKNSIPVAVVNRKFAEKIFGSADNAIGRYYKMKDGTRTQVVGIVEDGKYGLLTEKQQSAMFLPVLQSSAAIMQSSNEAWLVVRSNADEKAMGTAIRNKLHDLDSSLPCFIETWDSGLGLTMFPARMAAISLGVLGILGAMLSVTGIFGVAANAVSKRRRELGIRVALGAKRSQVSRAVLARPFKLLAFGSLVGLLLGILASGVVGAIVYDATARDPLVLGGVVLAMALIGLLGTWIPARRALSIDASKLLRED